MVYLSEAKGQIGEVYKTSTGLELADPYEDDRGWEQIRPITRRLVESRDVGSHLRWMVWVEVK
jgi:hypothetical protein